MLSWVLKDAISVSFLTVLYGGLYMDFNALYDVLDPIFNGNSISIFQHVFDIHAIHGLYKRLQGRGRVRKM